MANLSLVFDLLAKDNASKTFNDVGDAAEKAGKKGEGFGGAVSGAMKLAGGAILGAGIVEGFKSFYQASADGQKVTRLTEQVIKSTGGAAQITSGQVQDLATAISAKTGVDDQAIQSGANLLLTFTNVKNEAGKGNDIFNQTTKIMTDMSAALGTDASGSAIQLGKALNDPVKGVTALTKVGVSFTDQQKDQIKTLVDSGNTLGAQKVILGELSKEFGGAAEAASSPMQKLQTNLGILQGTIGDNLYPVVNNLASFAATTLLPNLMRLGGYIGDKLGPIFTTLGGFAKQAFDILFHSDFTGGPLEEDSPIVDKLFDLRDGLATLGGIAKQAFDILFKGDFTHGPLAEDSGFVDTLFKLRDGFGRVKDAVVGFATGLAAFATSDQFVGWMKSLGSVLADVFAAAVDVFGFITDHSTIFGALAVSIGVLVAAFKLYEFYQFAIAKATAVWAAVQETMNLVLAANPIGLVIVALTALVAGLVFAYKNSETFRDIVNGVFHSVADIGQWLWNNALKPAFEAIQVGWQLLVKGVQLYWDFYLHPVFTAVATVAQFLWSNILSPTFSAIQGGWSAMSSGIRAVYDRVIQPAFSAVSSAVGAVSGAFGTAVSAISTTWDRIKSAAAAPINFVIGTVLNDGLIKAFNAVVGFVGLDKFKIGKLATIPGFDSGGYTGPGGRKTPAGIVHAGEIVWSQDDIARAGGIRRVEAARLAGLLPGYDIGGIVGAVGGAIKGAASKAVDFTKDVAGAIADPLGALKSAISGPVSQIAGSPFMDPVKELPGKLVGYLADWVKDKVGSFFGGGSDSSGSPSSVGSGVERWRGTVLQVLGMLGQPGSLANGILSLIQSESGGNPNAINLTDSNARAGHPSQGLMQTIPTTFARWAGPLAGRGITDPLANIYAGVAYALATYGPGMLASGGRHSGGKYIGYDLGTNYVPQDGLAMLHRGEAVVPVAQNQGAAYQGGPATFHLYDSDGHLFGTMRGIAQQESSEALDRAVTGAQRR